MKNLPNIKTGLCSGVFSPGKKLHTMGLTALVLSLANVSPVFAQQAGTEISTIEEIFVTGRLREESLQDVPASVTAMPGEELKTDGVLDVQLLSEVVPNFSYTTNVGASDNLFLRGLGTVGAGPQFEPAVGQQINGVLFSRSRVGRSGFFDIGQVEVVRGPQGASSGRNTSLGLVNIVPSKPTEEFEGSVSARYDFEDRQGYEVDAYVSGAITDGIRGRFAVSTQDSDGYVDNLNPTVGGTAGGIEDMALRGTVEFDIGESATLELMAQYVDSERDGIAREIVGCFEPDSVLAGIGDDCQLNRTNVSRGDFDGRTVDEGLDVEFELYTATLDVELTDTMTLTAITGVTGSDIVNVDDVDLSSRERFLFHNAESFDQFSQEIRIAGELVSGTRYIFGGIYSDYELDFVQLGDYSFAANRRRVQLAEQENDSFSIFADLTHEFSDTIELNAGVRYSEETRAARAGTIQTDIFSYDNELGDCTGNGLTGCRFFPDFPEFGAGTILAGEPAVTGAVTGVPSIPAGPLFEVKDDEVTWNLNLRWRPVDDNMYYVSYATGFKAGAFNLLSVQEDNALNEQTFSVDPETSWSAEIGGRHSFDLGDGNFVFNWTLFNTVVEDQQISSLVPAFSIQIVTNANEARSQGFEIDGSYTEGSWSVDYHAAFADAEYTDYNTGACWQGQPQQAVPASGSFALGELGAGQCGLTEVAPGTTAVVQNRTGASLTQAPRAQFGIDISKEIDLSAMTLTPSFGMNYIGKHFTDTELAPRSMNDAVTLVHARLVLADISDKWEVALVGRNLTEETYITFFNETSQLNGFGGGAFAFANVGRTLALTGRINF